MIFEALDQILLQRLGVTRDAESPIIHMTPGATCDLRQLRRQQVAELLAIELSETRERDVVDVEIEAHADCIGRNQKVNVT